jgi:hypothetical protein
VTIFCTKANPWKPGAGTPVAHDTVEEVGDQIDGWPAGDIQRMRCKNCGAEWSQELPQ